MLKYISETSWDTESAWGDSFPSGFMGSEVPATLVWQGLTDDVETLAELIVKEEFPNVDLGKETVIIDRETQEITRKAEYCLYADDNYGRAHFSDWPDDPQAQADLARVLMSLAKSLDPAGPGDDFTAAFDLTRKSAAQDNGDGIWTLALCYEHGRGVAQDEQAAIELYQRGAELGHAPSQHSLACYYFQGDVLDLDYEKGFDLCMKSARQGYGLAMRDLGQCYQFGFEVTGNMKTALEWYEKALEVIDDPELEEKVAMFKEVCEEDEDWGEDFT